MITLKLQNEKGSKTWELLEVPITERQILGVKQVETKDGNISTYFKHKKRQWVQKFSYMTDEEYAELVALRDEQFNSFKYPLLTIETLGVVDVPVYLELNDRSIMRYDKMVSDVKLTMRETR